jgi:hypothetical protein
MASITDDKKRGRGRPRVGALHIGVRVPPAELAAVDAWIEAQPDAPTRPEAIRRLVAIALAGQG